MNQVTPALFHQAPDARALASADVGLVEATIKEIGLAPTKAKNIIATAKLLIEQHGGEVPRTFAELEALPGVGHKTASVVMSQCHGCATLVFQGIISMLLSRDCIRKLKESPPLQGCSVSSRHAHTSTGGAMGLVKRG